jgi:hypothetical protein
MPNEQKKASNSSKKESKKVGQQIPEEVLLTWEAPVRPFKKRGREFYSTAGAIAILVAVILIFLKEWFLIILIAAFLFFSYVLATIPPQKTEHRLTNKGILTNNKKYIWENLGRFWFSEQWGQKILNVETPGRFPGQLILLLGEQEEKDLEKILAKYLENETPKPGFMEKAGKWVSEKVPLEKPTS